MTMGPEDLGLATEDCEHITEFLGAPPPWRLDSLQTFWDHMHPGWDACPTLNLSSPVSRLRALSMALDGSHDHIDEVLKDLPQEIKHAHIRVMAPREDNSLEDECNFLLCVLDVIGTQLLKERLARWRERDATAADLADAREAVRAAELNAAAKDAENVRFEELSAEAEAQRHRADHFMREAEKLQLDQQHLLELEGSLQDREKESLYWKNEHERLQEELRDARARSGTLTVANEEMEGELRDLRRQIENAQRDGGGQKQRIDEGNRFSSGTVVSLSSKIVQTDLEDTIADRSQSSQSTLQAFVSGAHKALALFDKVERVDGFLRSTFLAWRCARLEAQYTRVTAHAASESLDADLSLVGSSNQHGPGKCCCKSSTCCRVNTVNVLLDMWQREVERANFCETEGEKAIVRLVRFRRAVAGFAITIFTCLLWFLLELEPYLDIGYPILPPK